VELTPSLLPQASQDNVTKLELVPAHSLVQDDLISAIATPDTPLISEPESNRSFWKVFTSTFITIFLAELGDKTQVSTMLMSAESHQPWLIFAGASAALISTTLLGVLVGRWLSNRLSPRTLDVSAGVLLLLVSVWLIWDVLK
jgi:putative Ca2+/H+ antiporter (TMEM165/GDT1 family)